MVLPGVSLSCTDLLKIGWSTHGAHLVVWWWAVGALTTRVHVPHHPVGCWVLYMCVRRRSSPTINVLPFVWPDGRTEGDCKTYVNAVACSAAATCIPGPKAAPRRLPTDTKRHRPDRVCAHPLISSSAVTHVPITRQLTPFYPAYSLAVCCEQTALAPRRSSTRRPRRPRQAPGSPIQRNGVMRDMHARRAV